MTRQNGNRTESTWNPFGFRKESERIPKASRAGALHSTPRYVTPLQFVGHLQSQTSPRRDARLGLGATA